MTAGRPTSYKDEYCDLVVKMGKRGDTAAMMASELDVAKSTLYKWAEDYPKFSDALKKAKDAAQAYWEKVGHENMVDGKLNTGLYNKIMSCRFRDDYSEQKDPQTVVSVDYDKLTDSQKKALIPDILKEIREEY